MGPGARWQGPLGLSQPAVLPWGEFFDALMERILRPCRGPEGLEEGEQAAQGVPPLDPLPGTVEKKWVADCFDEQVRILLCRMAYPAVTHRKIAAIRNLAQQQKVTSPEKALGYTMVRYRTERIGERSVAGRRFLTAIARLEATEIVLPAELWDESEIPQQPGVDRARQLADYRAAHDELLAHEQGHLTETFETLSDYSLGYSAAWDSPSSTLPTLAEFTRQVRSSDESACGPSGVLATSAAAWDDRDSFVVSRMAGHGIRIDDGMNPPRPFYTPQP